MRLVSGFWFVVLGLEVVGASAVAHWSEAWSIQSLPAILPISEGVSRHRRPRNAINFCARDENKWLKPAGKLFSLLPSLSKAMSRPAAL